MDLLAFLKENVVPATGCTEPGAVAYAVSIAYHALYQDHITIDSDGAFQFSNNVPPFELESLKILEIEVDQNVYKNAYSAIIPGTNGLKGIKVAAALALYLNPEHKLNILNNVNLLKLEKIKQILNNDLIKVSYREESLVDYLLSIDITLEYEYHEKIKTSQVKIRETHDNIIAINVDGTNLFKRSDNQMNVKPKKNLLNLEEILNSVEMASNTILKEINHGILMNERIADEGLRKQYGINVAKNLKLILSEEECPDFIISEVKIKVASAGDARMGGSNLPVMTTSGSGNMGITAILPVAIVGKRKCIPKRKIQRAVLLSHIICSIADRYHGHLSVLCGAAIKAGFGVAAAITYLLNGTSNQIHIAINLMAANNVGFLCDGAKPGCALKISTAAGIATECAFLALNDQKIGSNNGIIFEDPDKTLKSIGSLCHSIYTLNKQIIHLLEKNDKS